MIVLVDNGPGNHTSLVNMLRKVGCEDVTVSSEPAVLAKADGLVLPGVGHFSAGAEALEKKGLRGPLAACVQEQEVPFLGVCVGMQLLAAHSEEGPGTGLGWIEGKVARLRPSGGLKVPQMGWNVVHTRDRSRLLSALPPGQRYYFVHSYALEGVPDAKVAATCDYGGEIVCAIEHKNVFGVQFHPERSHRFGMALMARFVDLCG